MGFESVRIAEALYDRDMLSSLFPWLLAQIPLAPIPIPVTPPPILAPAPPPAMEGVPQEIRVFQPVRPLPGGLDQTPVLNGNNPELIFNEGIILSTFPSIGMGSPYAHLNYAFRGRFDVFAHHVVQASPEGRTLYLAILLFNDGKGPAQVDILQGASSLTSPDALFMDLPPQAENPQGSLFSGPGSRVTGDVLRGQRYSAFPPQISIPPGQSYLLINQPLPVNYRPDPSVPPPLKLPRNGFSGYWRLQTNQPLFGASLAMYAPRDSWGQERPPTLAEWERLLRTSALMIPRDRIPRNSQRRIYSRVAGVSQGSVWRATLADAGSQRLRIPEPGQAFSYPISALEGGRLGTGQNQSAPMLKRYPDTAYESHGNYGVQYSLNLPLYNPTSRPQRVSLSIETPLKFNDPAPELRFLEPTAKNVHFRGTVQFRYADDQKTPQNRYFHLVQRRGQRGEDLITLTLQPGEIRAVQVDLLYPPDATPPQLLTVRSAL